MKQVTYDGHPLYRFVKDPNAGTTNGQGVSAFGGSWFAVSPAGKQASGGAPKRTAPTKPAAPAAPAEPAAPSKPAAPPKPAAAAPKSNGIPQNNGGDHDSDNSGGPDDGDGGI